MQIELSQENLTALIEQLGALAWRYETDAASLARLDGLGRTLAEKYLAEARTVKSLQDFFLFL